MTTVKSHQKIAVAAAAVDNVASLGMVVDHTSEQGIIENCCSNFVDVGLLLVLLAQMALTLIQHHYQRDEGMEEIHVLLCVNEVMASVNTPLLW